MPESSPQDDKSQKSGSALDTLLKTSSLLAATTWIFFLLGWFYLHAFYFSFGIDVNMLDLPIYYPVITSGFSLIILFKLLRIAVFIGIPISILWVFKDTIDDWLNRLLPRSFTRVFFQPRSPHKERAEQVSRWASKFFWVTSAIVILLTLATVSIEMGQEDGKEWHQHPSINTAKVCLNFKKEEEQFFNPELVKANANGTLMLLVQTKELVLVFVKDEQGKAKGGVFTVPRANLLSVYNSGPCVNRPSQIVSPPAAPEKPKRRHT